MSLFSESVHGASQLWYLYKLHFAKGPVASPSLLCQCFLKRPLGGWSGQFLICGQMRDALCRL